MENGYISAETSIKTGVELGGKGYFGNEHYCRFTHIESIFDGTQVHLGFTRTRNAVEQHGFFGAVFHTLGNGVHRILLGIGERRDYLVLKKSAFIGRAVDLYEIFLRNSPFYKIGNGGGIAVCGTQIALF